MLHVQVYKRFVEVGRVALINEGPDQGKLCVIIDVVDQRRVRGICTSLTCGVIAVVLLGFSGWSMHRCP